MKIVQRITALLMSLFLYACSSSSQTQIDGPALEGYCVVCYHSANKAVKGSAEFTSEYQGKSYYFVSQKAQNTFEAEPEKYLPQYDGWCAYGMTYGKKVGVDPTVFSIVDEKLYLNKSKTIGNKFDKNTARYITKADAKWRKFR